jgi:hypothetical protein
MSTTRDWMHGSEDWSRPRQRTGLLGIVALSVMGLAVAGLAAIAVLSAG